MKKSRLFGLAVLAIILGSSEVVWGQDEPSDLRYNYRSDYGGNWEESTTWSSQYGNTGVPTGSGHSVGIYTNTVILNSDCTIKRMDVVHGGILNIANGTLTVPGELKFYEGAINIAVNGQLSANNAISLLYSDVTIDGYDDGNGKSYGNMVIAKAINGNSHILTTSINVTASGSDNFNNFNLVVAGSTFTNNRNGKTINSLEVSGGKFVANYTTYCGSLTLSGGAIEIASGATLKSNDRILTVNGNDTIVGSGTLDVTTINVAEGDTLTIDGDIKLKENVTINGVVRINNDVVFQKNATINDTIIVEPGKKLTISGGGVTFSDKTCFKGGGIIELANASTTIYGLETCTGGNIVFPATVTYETTSTHILPGNYTNLTLKAAGDYEERILCGNVEVSGTFAPNKHFTLKSDGDDTKELVVKGGLTGNKALTFNKVNVTLGNSEGDGTINVDIMELNIPETNTLTIAGNVKLSANRNKKFGGVDGKNGEIIINDGKLLTTEGTINFVNDQTIRGEGSFETDKQISGTKLTTLANVNLTGGSGSAIEHEVAGGTFTNTNATNNYYVAKLTVNGGTYVSATDKTIRDLTVEAGTFVVSQNSKVDAMTVTGGTVQVDKDKTLTVTTGNKLNVDGTATFVGKAGSKFITDNVELFEGAALTIKDTVTLTRPLVVNNNATLVGGTVSDTLKWDSPEHCKISVAAGTLTISNALSVGGNVTLDGAIKVAVGGNLNLAGNAITFGPTAKFTDTQGTISFVAGVVISGLKNDPDVEAKYLKFPGAVTYDATCAAMFPGVYGNGLTLNTEAGKNIAIYDSVKITGAFSWAAGRIVLNGNPLIVKETFNSGSFDENHMVVAGKNSKYIFVADAASTGLDLTVPIGTGSLTSAGTLLYSYSPATINIGEAVAIGDTISVEVEGEALLGKATDLRRYWTISSNQNFTGDVTFKFTAADDLLGYGSKDYWAVFHGSSVYEKGGAQIKSPFDKYFSITDENINGVWTACEYPAAVTLYSFGSGNWDSPSSWTTNSAGSTQPAEGAQAPNERCDVVILPGSVITGKSAGVRARSVTLKNETSTLVINPDCADVSIVNLTGEGRLVIKNKGSFPEGIDNTDLFMAPGGGTTEFSGSSSGEYELSKTEFNNLIINLEDGAEVKL
ncbi:MAG: hypothetical protein J6T12_09450, partial [Salinivirgaceae bacterium]|nr:hypothetical protein [Salinivirgaceae bacterium]